VKLSIRFSTSLSVASLQDIFTILGIQFANNKNCYELVDVVKVMRDGLSHDIGIGGQGYGNPDKYLLEAGMLSNASRCRRDKCSYFSHY